MSNYAFNKESRVEFKSYLLSLIIIFLFTCMGSLVYALLNLLLGNDSSYFDFNSGEFIGLDPLRDLLFSHIVDIFTLIGIWISIQYVQGRNFISLITSNSRINWKRILWGFTCYFLLYGLVQLIIYLIFPNYYVLNKIDFNRFLVLFLIGLALVPIQTTVEELFFRGFLLQWISKKISNPIILCIIIAVIFAAVHFGNPEMKASAIWIGLSYIVTGLFLTNIALKTGSLEISIGAHAANNMFLTWFISDDNSVNGALPAVFHVNYIMDPFYSFLLVLVIWSSFYFLLFKQKVHKFMDFPSKKMSL